MTTEERLQQIRERVAAASDDWEVEHHEGSAVAWLLGPARGYDGEFEYPPDAHLAANAKPDLSFLLSLLEEKDKRIEELETALQPVAESDLAWWFDAGSDATWPVIENAQRVLGREL